MSTPHDPLLKTTIRNRLYALLYTPADTRMFERLKDIIMRNAVLVNASHASFMFKAVNYSCDTNKILPRPRNQLDSRLEGLMLEYLADEAELQQEKPTIHAYLTQVLNTSDYPEDWLKLLIPTLHGPVQELIKDKGLNPCRFKHLEDEFVAQFLEKNRDAVQLMKRRLVTNLIVI